MLRLKPAAVLQPLAIQVVAQLQIQAAVLQQVVAQLQTQAAVLRLQQLAVHHLTAATPAVTAVAAERSASKCQSSVAQKFVAQSSVAQRSVCLSATLVVAADVAHHADHPVAQLVNQAAVHQSLHHVPALATDIKSAKG